MQAMFSKKKTMQPMNSQTKLMGCWELNLTLGGKKKTFNNHINHFVNLNNEELSINMCLKSITSQDPTAWIILN